VRVHEALLDRYAGDDGLVVEAAWATWDLAVFTVEHRGATGVVAVPRPRLDAFLADLWSGRLDTRLTTEIRARRVRRRRLASSDEATEVAMYGGVADPTRLAPRERDVRTGRIQPPGGPRGRDHKRRSDDSSRRRVRRFSTRVIVAGAIIATAGVAGTALALSGGGSGHRSASTRPNPVTAVTDPGATDQSIQYQVTVTVTSLETDDTGDRPPSTFTVGWYCGGRRIEGDREIPDCSADPRDAWSYFAAGFDLPEPARSSFHFERPLPTCTPGPNDGLRSGMIIDVKGYGSDTLSGTYEAGYRFIKCALDPSGDTEAAGYTVGFHITATFVARRVDELTPMTTTSTTGAPSNNQPVSPQPTGPVVAVS
jgi:hypothetical protein